MEGKVIVAEGRAWKWNGRKVTTKDSESRNTRQGVGGLLAEFKYVCHKFDHQLHHHST